MERQIRELARKVEVLEKKVKALEERVLAEEELSEEEEKDLINLLKSPQEEWVSLEELKKKLGLAQ